MEDQTFGVHCSSAVSISPSLAASVHVKRRLPRLRQNMMQFGNDASGSPNYNNLVTARKGLDCVEMPVSALEIVMKIARVFNHM